MSFFVAANILRSPLHPLTRDWQAAIRANGGDLPLAQARVFDRLFVRPCVGDGLWDLIADCAFFVGLPDLNSIFVKLKTPTGVSRILTNTNFVSGDYTATGSNAGLLGNGTTKFLNTNTPANTVTTASGSAGVYSGNFAIGTGDRNSLGSGGASNAGVIALQNRNSSATISRFFNNNTTSINVDASPALASGFLAGSSISLSDLRIFSNGSQTGIVTTLRTEAKTTQPVHVFCYNANGTAANFLQSDLRFYFLGSGMSASQVANLSTRVNAVMTAFSANVY